MNIYDKATGKIDNYITLLNILKIYINPKNITFYHFGSGDGKIINYFSFFFRKSVGVEIYKERYSISFKNNDNIKLMNKNFFDVKLDNKFVLLANNISFEIEVNERLSYKILKEIENFCLIVVTKKLMFLEKYYLSCFDIHCSWGFIKIYLYYIIK